MYKKLLLFFVLLVLATGCSRIPPPVKNHILKNKSFVYLFFETEAECMENQPDPDFFINCYQQVDFLEDNKVRIVLTDIIHDGTYRIESNKIILTLNDTYEVPSGILEFEYLNPNLIYNLESKTYWKRLKGNSVWD